MKRALVVVCSMLITCVPAFSQTVVTSCGQRVLDGVLAADLDCSAQVSEFAVIVEPHGSLDLAGHQLIAGTAADWGLGGAVRCEDDCTIDGGGGSITSSLPYNWQPDERNLPSGVLGTYPRKDTVQVSNVTITGFVEGVDAYRLAVDHVTASQNFVALIADRLTAASCVLTANNQAISGNRAVFTNCDVTDNHFGMTLRRVELTGTRVTGNDDFGIFAADGARVGRLSATNSSINGNCADTLSDECWDFATSGNRTPVLVDTDCSISGRFVLGSQTWTTWGLCALD